MQEVSGIYTPPILDTAMNQKWLYGPETFPGLSKKWPLVPVPYSGFHLFRHMPAMTLKVQKPLRLR